MSPLSRCSCPPARRRWPLSSPQVRFYRYSPPPKPFPALPSLPNSNTTSTSSDAAPPYPILSTVRPPNSPSSHLKAKPRNLPLIKLSPQQIVPSDKPKPSPASYRRLEKQRREKVLNSRLGIGRRENEANGREDGRGDKKPTVSEKGSRTSQLNLRVFHPRPHSQLTFLQDLLSQAGIDLKESSASGLGSDVTEAEEGSKRKREKGMGESAQDFAVRTLTHSSLSLHTRGSGKGPKLSAIPPLASEDTAAEGEQQSVAKEMASEEEIENEPIREEGRESSHNTPLILFGRRALRFHLSTFIASLTLPPLPSLSTTPSTSSTSNPNSTPLPSDIVNWESIRFCLDTKNLGEWVGNRWGLSRPGPAGTRPRTGDEVDENQHEKGGVVGWVQVQSYNSNNMGGWTKVKGSIIEAIFGGVTHRFGLAASHQLFTLLLLPHLLPALTHCLLTPLPRSSSSSSTTFPLPWDETSPLMRGLRWRRAFDPMDLRGGNVNVDDGEAEKVIDWAQKRREGWGKKGEEMLFGTNEQGELEDEDSEGVWRRERYTDQQLKDWELVIANRVEEEIEKTRSRFAKGESSEVGLGLGSGAAGIGMGINGLDSAVMMGGWGTEALGAGLGMTDFEPGAKLES